MDTGFATLSKHILNNPMLLRFFRLSGLKVAVAATLVVVLTYYFDPDFLSLLELKTLDLRFLHRGRMETSGKIVLVSIDEKSIDELGRWPWPRGRMAELLDILVQGEAKVVGFDIVWAEPDESSEQRSLSVVRRKLKELKVSNRQLENYLTTAIRDADPDRILGDSVARSRRAVLGYIFGFHGGDGAAMPNTPLPASLTSYSPVKYTSPDSPRAHLFRANTAAVNVPAVGAGAAGSGYFNIFPDRDGTVRWAPLVIEYQGRHFCSLPLSVLQKYLDNPPLSLRIADFGVEEIRLGDRVVPTNEEGRILINYRGPKQTFPYYPAADVLHHRVPPGVFKGKIVLVGATALGIYDIRVTPFDQVFPGVEVHANVIDSILKQQYLYRPNWVSLFDVAAIISIGLILGLILPRVSAPGGAAAGCLFLVLFLVFARFLFQEHGIWVNMTYPLLNLVLVYSGITGYRHTTEERERKKVRGAFQHYLSPAVIEQMLKDPSRLKLGGEKKELTVLFSDIRGFTSISERIDPETLVRLLNIYLTKMTNIVLENRGLLDKYVGDGLMAVWGAPLDQEDHAERACAAALEMMAALDSVRKGWAAEGLSEIEIGIGISTGPMVVGNMGSERRFSYTVLGDRVNLGSRLEGLNKIYGTHIIISEATWEKVRKKFPARRLDSVRVKGKGQPVIIYELLAGTPGQEKLAGEFESALAEYDRGRWDEALVRFQSLVDSYPQDGPAGMYVERCRFLKENPPPGKWDGIFRSEQMKG